MASDREFVDYLLDQMQGAGVLRQRKMFGEYAIYCDDKVVALVCDNQLFVKPTDAGRNLIEAASALREAPAYPGAKPSLLIESLYEDGDWLRQLIRATAAELPAPAPKKPKKAKPSKPAKSQHPKD